MANPWFRFYAEFLHDPKVRVMSDSDQLRLVLLLCLRCNGDVTLQDKHVTFSLRISDAEWQQTKAVFVENGFIDSDNNVLNWDKRQFVSDSSVERVRKHRALHRTVTSKQRNVTVTPPEQNRTDTEQNIKPTCTSPNGECADEENNPLYTKAFLTFWEMYPRKKSKGDAAKAFAKLKAVEYSSVRAGLIAAKESPDWLKDNGQFIPHPGTWLRARGWEDEQSGAIQANDPIEVIKSRYPAGTSPAEMSTGDRKELLRLHSLRMDGRVAA